MTQQPRLDKFGRVLIPKKIREELGLQLGEAVTLELEGNSLRLHPAAREAILVEHHGRLILEVPGMPSQTMSNEVVDEMRQARDAEILRDWPGR